MTNSTGHNNHSLILPKEYAKLKESEFPLTINGIEYKTKQELTDRYEADLMAMAQLIYDIYQEKRSKPLSG